MKAGASTSVDAMCAEILDAMEQGAALWSADGRCLYLNKRFYSVLEYSTDDVWVGMCREDFFEMALNRGEFSSDWGDQLKSLAGKRSSFTYDRHLPSGRIVATTVRRLEDGRDVVTYTDVTAARKLTAELDAAKQAAEEAEKRSAAALTSEKERQHQVTMVSALGEWLQSCKSLEELYKIVSGHMARLLPGSSGELYIYSNSRDVLDGACCWGDTSLQEHINVDDCWGLRRGRSYTYGAGEVEFECGHVAEQNWQKDFGCYFCIPIVAHGDTVGLLHVKLGQECQPRACTSSCQSLNDKRRFVIQCAEHISLAVANVKLRDELRDQSIRDALTGLFNRRYLIENLRREVARATKNGRPLSLISCDADHFKKLNDNHGHDAGDSVLRAISEVMSHMFDGDEVCCRFGGEEFLILLPDTDRPTALRRAEELRLAVEGHIVRYGNTNLPPVTLSLGVATAPEDGTIPQALISKADVALYRAKAEGRNKVCLADDDSE